MKTAYELAMERLNKSAPPAAKLTAAQKKQLAELDSKYAAKIAEREIFLKDELAKASPKGDWEAVEQLEKQIISEKKSLAAELEEKKELVRQGKAS
jgi:hypothetical protein